MPMVDMGKVDENASGGGSGEKVDKPGKYLVQIKHVTVRQDKAGNEWWGLLCEIVDGDEKGKILFDNLFWSERAMPRTKKVLAALGIEVPEFKADAPPKVVDYQPGMVVGCKAHVELKESGDPAYPLNVPWDGWSRDYPF